MTVIQTRGKVSIQRVGIIVNLRKPMAGAAVRSFVGLLHRKGMDCLISEELRETCGEVCTVVPMEEIADRYAANYKITEQELDISRFTKPRQGTEPRIVEPIRR